MNTKVFVFFFFRFWNQNREAQISDFIQFNSVSARHLVNDDNNGNADGAIKPTSHLPLKKRQSLLLRVDLLIVIEIFIFEFLIASCRY